jgi:hypothetical protein
MAIYIQIRKTDEDQTGAIYEFGPSEGIIGAVFIARATREVSLLRIDDPKKEEFYLSRVRRALQRDSGGFPDSTCYAA